MENSGTAQESSDGGRRNEGDSEPSRQEQQLATVMGNVCRILAQTVTSLTEMQTSFHRKRQVLDGASTSAGSGSIASEHVIPSGPEPLHQDESSTDNPTVPHQGESTTDGPTVPHQGESRSDNTGLPHQEESSADESQLPQQGESDSDDGILVTKSVKTLVTQMPTGAVTATAASPATSTAPSGCPEKKGCSTPMLQGSASARTQNCQLQEDIRRVNLYDSISLAQRPLPKFSEGTCGEFWEFKRALQRRLESAEVTDGLRLEVLVDVYNGPVKDALRGCLRIEDYKTGYEQAWELLDKRHGDKYEYIRQLTKKVLHGPSVQLQDEKGLQRLADELEHAIRDLKLLGKLQQIDTYEATQTLTGRFKGKLWDDYINQMYRYKMKHEETPGVEWILKFVKLMVQKAETSSKAQTQGMSRESRQPLPDRKPVSLVTATSDSTVHDGRKCSLCKEDHHLGECTQFLRMTSVKREAVIRAERRCFACLSRHHRIADCHLKKRCGIDGCLGVHSHLLHHLHLKKGAQGAKGTYNRDEQSGAPRMSGSKRTAVSDDTHPDRTAAHKRPRITLESTPDAMTSRTRTEQTSVERDSTRGHNVLVTVNKDDPYRWVKSSQGRRQEEPDEERS
ncbi:uncharacterized protein LOC126990645 [Eriocheir sinensis]|uniref:uncharacterized protein LOC126990645 n=1 Tax=Eriocheir sinensis TaxID=95602 RepID=UPI0021C7D13D|nr:uncharacterized protein LOC126990645 [Eriocheir sinensis]